MPLDVQYPLKLNIKLSQLCILGLFSLLLQAGMTIILTKCKTKSKNRLHKSL